MSALLVNKGVPIPFNMAERCCT